MDKYRKKPQVVNALRWTGYNLPELHQILPPGTPVEVDSLTRAVYFPTVTGRAKAEIGDFVVQQPTNHLDVYPVPKDVFLANYEKAE